MLLGMPNLTAEQLDLSTRVRERTMMAHRNAESRPFIVSLMKGELSLDDYTRYLAQLAWVYEALESRQAQPSDPGILDARLARSAAIDADLSALGASDWRGAHPASTATERYTAHLRSIAQDDLPRYLAHHYTRYLGDLSGGQAIARLVARHYGATEQQLSYYRFDVEDIVHFKRAYRDGMDAIGFDAEQADVFCAEADAAFGFNSDIFDALGVDASIGG